MKIKFNAIYREQIDNGTYEVVYGPSELPVTVLDWNLRSSKYHILIKIGMEKTDSLDFLDDNGDSLSKIEVNLIVPDPERPLTQFEENLLAVIKASNRVQLPADSPLFSKMAIEFGKDLIDVAREQLRPEIDEELDKAYKNRDEVVYQQGFNEALSLMCWKKIDSDKYDGEDIPLSIVRSTDMDGDYRYSFGTFVYPVQEYIPIADLEKLKPKKFEAQ